MTKSKDCSLLDAMSVYDAVDTMERVGAASIGGLKKRWQSAGSLGIDPDVLRARGFLIVSSGRVANLLDDLLAEYRSARPGMEPALTTAYGWFYHWFSLKGGRQFSEILSDAFMTHARENFHMHGALFREDAPLLATYSLSRASKECGIGKKAMRKLGVQLGMIRSSTQGRVLAFDGASVRTLAEDFRESVNFSGATAILGVEYLVLRGLVDFGLVAPLFGGPEWQREYVFRRRDLDAFINRILGNSPAVDAPRESQMTASNARRVFRISVALYLRLVAEGRVKIAAHLKKGSGVAGALVDSQELKKALLDITAREDMPIPMTSLALETHDLVVRKLIEKRFLHSYEGASSHAVVTAKSLARFRSKFIGAREIARMLGCDMQRVEYRVSKLGVRFDPALRRCGFRGFLRSQVDPKLSELKGPLRNDLRFNSPAARESRAA